MGIVMYFVDRMLILLCPRGMPRGVRSEPQRRCPQGHRHTGQSPVSIAVRSDPPRLVRVISRDPGIPPWLHVSLWETRGTVVTVWAKFRKDAASDFLGAAGPGTSFFRCAMHARGVARLYAHVLTLRIPCDHPRVHRL